MSARDRVIELVRVRAGDLAEHPSNWRRHPAHQRAALRGLLSEVGYADALIARRDADRLVLIDGHLRKSLDPDQVVPVLVLDVSEQEADKLLLALDPLAGLARPDPVALQDLIGRVRTQSDALAELIEGLARQARIGLSRMLTDPEQIPQAPEPRARPGDLFCIGSQRLLCGDARSRSDLRRLMGRATADLLVTDPPYGVGYVGKTKRALRIAGDEAGGLRALLDTAFARAGEVLRAGAPIYVFSPAGELSVVFAQAFCAQGWRLHQTIVWVKDVPVLGHADYHYRHEPILYGYVPSETSRGRGKAGWYGGDAQHSVIEVPRPKASADHPTQKPVELIRRLIANSSRSGQGVLDPFCGSGTTLVACELLGRRGFGVEIDPGYCDVALARLEALTGARANRRRR
jgi:DNA modification methylase